MTSGVYIPLPLKEIGCQELLNKGNVAYHGILRRQTMVQKLTSQMLSSVLSGGQVKKTSGPQHLLQWPRRYIVLYEGCLYMFKSETSNKPSYAVSLYGYSKIERQYGEVQGKVPWPFKLVNALNDKDNSIYLSAPTERDLTIWIERLEQQMIFANGFNAAGPTPNIVTNVKATHSEPDNVKATDKGHLAFDLESRSSGSSIQSQRSVGDQSEYIIDDDDDDDYDQITEQWTVEKPASNVTHTGFPKEGFGKIGKAPVRLPSTDPEPNVSGSQTGGGSLKPVKPVPVPPNNPKLSLATPSKATFCNNLTLAWFRFRTSGQKFI